MEFNQKQQHNLIAEQQEPRPIVIAGEGQESEELSSVAVVRSNTPKARTLLASEHQNEPLQLPSFPTRAPSAPPLPEELEEAEEENSSIVSAIPLSSKPRPLMQEAQEFAWLFEYSLEMDGALLNSAEKLNGLALLYGPAVLKGYRLLCGTGSQGTETIATIVPDQRPGAEVWGVLYRIPRRLSESHGSEAAQLDIAHSAVGPQNLFRAAQVVVQETYREREIACLTYSLTEKAQQELQLHPPEANGRDALFLQRLGDIARKQKLPESYLGIQSVQDTQMTQAPLMANPTTQVPVCVEQNTEPLPLLSEQRRVLSEPGMGVTKTSGLLPVSSSRWLVVFAFYLVALFLSTLAFAVLQGLGLTDRFLTAHFAPLSVPWQVLVYGLMGGCISSIATLGYYRIDNPPLFVIITWFTRPFVGIVLAIFAYLLLTSGLFFLGEGNQHHTAFFLIGALAGLCEGYIFLRKRSA